MSERNDGGPAFPGIESPGGGYPGMSLRDYFAAQVLNMASYNITEPSDVAARAYRIADAMLIAREAK